MAERAASSAPNNSEIVVRFRLKPLLLSTHPTHTLTHKTLIDARGSPQVSRPRVRRVGAESAPGRVLVATTLLATIVLVVGPVCARVGRTPINRPCDVSALLKVQLFYCSENGQALQFSPELSRKLLIRLPRVSIP